METTAIRDILHCILHSKGIFTADVLAGKVGISFHSGPKMKEKMGKKIYIFFSSQKPKWNTGINSCFSSVHSISSF